MSVLKQCSNKIWKLINNSPLLVDCVLLPVHVFDRIFLPKLFDKRIVKFISVWFAGLVAKWNPNRACRASVNKINVIAANMTSVIIIKIIKKYIMMTLMSSCNNILKIWLWILTSPLGFVSTLRLYDPNASDMPRGCKNNPLGVLCCDYLLRILPGNDNGLNIEWCMLYDKNKTHNTNILWI